MSLLNEGSPCPCGSGRPFTRCCRPYLRGERTAPTAEALMRSRYTAHVRRDGPYLLRTWHPDRRPGSLGFDDTVWLGLEIHGTEAGGEDDATGVVSFEADYQQGDGPVETLRETSRFVRLDGEWVYVDGDVS